MPILANAPAEQVVGGAWRERLREAHQADQAGRRAVEVQVVGTEVRVLHLGEAVVTHELAAPGEASVKDEHYGGARSAPGRAPLRRSTSERAICHWEKWARPSSTQLLAPG